MTLREILPVCDVRATAAVAGGRYSAYETIQQRVLAMMAYMVSEGRLFALKPSEWSMLLVGVALCGLATLLF